MKTVFFDVDTQLDFLTPAGALSVRGAAGLAPGFAALTRFAAAHRIPIVATADAHAENDPEFQRWKPHCVAGTQGQAKFSGTLLAGAVTLPRDGLSTELPPDLCEAAQIIVEKNDLDPFTNPRLKEVLELLRAGRYVVYGLVTEYCVARALFGLVETGARVELVTDAVKGLADAAAQSTLERFTALGGTLTTVAAITATE